MTRPSPLLSRLAALLAVALVALAAGPATAAVADVLGPDCCTDHCPMAPPADGPEDGPVCCAPSPAVAHDAATAPLASQEALFATVRVVTERVARTHTTPCPADTGPPAGPRRHLTLSVFRV